nr:hypothetical protein [Tanacetum cinerariifolium]
MLGSIDCMHWEWVKCPESWHGQFGRVIKKYPTTMLEVVASQDLWIWHAFFGVAGANNDLTFLNTSPLFDELLDDIAHVVPFLERMLLASLPMCGLTLRYGGDDNPNKRKSSFSPVMITASVLFAAREKFTQEISFRSKDKDISLAKTLLYISAEDEAFMAYNREMDAHSLEDEMKDTNVSADSRVWDHIEAMPMLGKKIHDCSKSGSAILLSVIYIEICQRINLTMVGSRVGEDFLIWPETGNPEELFKVNSGQSLFGIVNGRCVDDPRSMASDLTCNSLLGLDIATNRDIIGIYLANLIRLHWKRASRRNRGLMLTSPLRPVDDDNEKWNDGSSMPLLRPQDLRLAIMASEKLLILQPHNWALRRDHGMMLYYSRDYEKAVQELSICMAFAPEEEAAVLEPFVEKLHLLQLESSWISREQKGRLTVP